MAGNAGGSYEDLSTLEDVPGEPMGTSGLMALHKLENLRIDKLKQMRKPSAPKGLNLPSIPGAGETVAPFHLDTGPVPCQEKPGFRQRGFHTFLSLMVDLPSMDSILEVFSNLTDAK